MQDHGFKDKQEGFLFSSVRAVGAYVGKAVAYFNESKILNLLVKKFGVHWVFDKITSVDIAKVNKQVEQIRKNHPDVSPGELSDLLVKNKLVYVGSTGFISGIAPGNIPGFMFDVVASTAAQAELIYEIAIAYGMDLKDPVRKGEVITLMALASGSNLVAEKSFKLVVDMAQKQIVSKLYNQAMLKVSTTLGQAIIQKFVYKLIPVCGGIIGAGMNIAILKAVGRVTKNYYEKVAAHGYVYEGSLPEDLKIMDPEVKD